MVPRTLERGRGLQVTAALEHELLLSNFFISHAGSLLIKMPLFPNRAREQRLQHCGTCRKDQSRECGTNSAPTCQPSGKHLWRADHGLDGKCGHDSSKVGPLPWFFFSCLGSQINMMVVDQPLLRRMPFKSKWCKPLCSL